MGTEEKLNNNIENEVEAKAGVSVTLTKGDQVANSARVNLLTGFASLSAKHTGTTGVLGVHIMSPIGLIDKAVKSWYLDPGESFNSSFIQTTKDTHYLRLESYDKRASGTGTLAPATIIA
ncbi:MAG: hypothetical protein ABS939_02965 [Psychrobacillus sp.]